MFDQLVTSSQNVDVEDLFDVVLESLFHLSLVPNIESQRVSPTHSPTQHFKVSYKHEEKASIDLTREILIDYQDWYCNCMEEEKS